MKVNINRAKGPNNVVLILSNGVTASKDSVMPAPNPAITVLGPDILPASSCNKVLYVSNATNPGGCSGFIRIKVYKIHTYAGLERVAND